MYSQEKGQISTYTFWPFALDVWSFLKELVLLEELLQTFLLRHRMSVPDIE